MSVILFYLALAAATAISLGVEWLMNRPMEPDGKPDLPDHIYDPKLLSEQDHQIAQQTAEAIRQCFGANLSESVPKMSAEQRAEATKQLIEELCGLYHISITSVNLVELPQNECGSYSTKTGSITLNSIYLMTNDIAAIREFLNTIVHELRHAVQLSVLQGNNFWQTSPETAQSWLNNLVPFSHYIKASRNFKRYAWQPVERDAAAFAYHSLKGVQ